MITASLNPAALASPLPAQAASAAPAQASGASFERELQRAAEAAPRARDESAARADTRREATRQADQRQQAQRRSQSDAQARAHEKTSAKPAADTADTAERAETPQADGEATAAATDNTENAKDNTAGSTAANAAEDAAASTAPDLAAFVASLGVRPDATPKTAALPNGNATPEASLAHEAADASTALQTGKPGRLRAPTTELQTRPEAATDSPRAATAEFQSLLRAAAPAQAETTLKGQAPDLSAAGPATTLALASGGTSAPATHTAATPAQATLAPAVGSREFAQALGAQLTTFAQDGVEHARLKVHPADLGPITLKLTLEGTQVRVDFSADAGATRQALEQALPSLAGALREAGLTLSGGGVFQQSRHGTNDGGAGGSGSGASEGEPGIDEAMPLRSRTVRLDGLVDLYA